MIIGIDASRANKSHKTGTEWYAFYLIRWFAKLDSENEYILYTNEPIVGGLLDLTTPQYLGTECDCEGDRSNIQFDKDGYQILKSPHNNFKAKILNWPFYFFWTQGRLSIEMLLHKPDVLFVPSHTLPIIHPEKSVITIHDVGFERDRYLYRKDMMGPDKGRGRRFINALVKIFTGGKYGANNMDYLRWSTEFGLKHATKILTVSNFSKEEMIEVFGADEKKVDVIYNGYNKFLYKRENDKSKIDAVLSKYGISGPYIFYVGRLEKKKNTPALIEAFAFMKSKNKNIPHKLVLVGDASYGYDEVNYTIREYNLDNDVVMPGWVEEMDMPYFYSGASAFVFPSKYEGFGIPLIQAMACEVPIAASWSSSIPEVVSGGALLFNPSDTHAMADAMEQILTDNSLRENLLLKANERIKDFSWEKSSQETLDIIKSLDDGNSKS